MLLLKKAVANGTGVEYGANFLHNHSSSIVPNITYHTFF